MANKRTATSRAPNDIDRQVGENVRRCRLDRNMTLAELGAELGISHQQLQKYETGTNRLSAGMLWEVASALGISVMELYGTGLEDPTAEVEAADEMARTLDTLSGLCTDAARMFRFGQVRKTMKRRVDQLAVTTTPIPASIHPIRAEGRA